MDKVCTQSAKEIFEELFQRYPSLESCREDILQAFVVLRECYGSGKKMLVCGNGGSAADAEHIVGELMKSFRFFRGLDEGFAQEYERVNGCEPPSWLEGSLPAISLTVHATLTTAFANDLTSEGYFAQQVYGYGCKGDVFWGISTSGSSGNVVSAAKVARAKGLKVLALTGSKASPLSELADVAIRVPETETFKIQEIHLPVYHCLCAMLEADIFGGRCDL